MGYYGGARRAARQHVDELHDQQRLHVRRDGRHHRQGRLRQLAADLHDPGVGADRRRASTWPRSPRSTASRTRSSFTVRDDSRATPRSCSTCCRPSTYQAYNIFGGKSLYFGVARRQHRLGHQPRGEGLLQPPAGSQRAASTNWFFGPDHNLLIVARAAGLRRLLHRRRARRSRPTPASCSARHLRRLRALRVLDARGVQRLSRRRATSASTSPRSARNTAYWKVRYEDGGRTLVCYKTVEGGGARGSGADQRQRLGPGRHQGHRRRRARRRRASPAPPTTIPQNSTTTFRDNGAPTGRPGRAARRPRRARHAREPALREHVRGRQRRAQLPGHRARPRTPTTSSPAIASGATPASRPTRRRTSARASSAGSGTRSRPRPSTPRASPPGVKRVTATNVQVATDNSWLQDEGRLRATTPPPGQPGTVGRGQVHRAQRRARVRRRARCTGPFGALGRRRTRASSRRPTTSSPTWASQPDTPDGITLDPGGTNRPRSRRFTISPNPTKSHRRSPSTARPRTTPTARSSSTSGTSTATAPTRRTPARSRPPRKSYSAEGSVDVRLTRDRQRRRDRLRRADRHDARQPAARPRRSPSTPTRSSSARP